MAQVSIEINGNVYFSQIWHGETLHTALGVKNVAATDKII